MVAFIVKVDGERHSHKCIINGLGGQNDISHIALCAY
jgi:hypothetical protein